MSADGGAAFPTYEFVQSHGQMMAVGGMTLRDYFAVKAMQGVVASSSEALNQEICAAWSYEMADAMLAAREVAT